MLQDGQWLALSFSGPREAYIALVNALKTENYRYVYWHAGFFGKQGAWIISMFKLPEYLDRFDNLRARLDEAQKKGLTA